MVWAAVLWYSVCTIIALHGRIFAREYMDRLHNQVHLIIQTFLNNSAVFQEDTAPIHSQNCSIMVWPAQSPNLNIIKLLWLVLGTGVRNRFPPPTFVKQLHVVQEECYKIPLETVQNLYEYIRRRIGGSIEGKSWSTTILIKKCVQYL
jgi:hypothetical protein